MSLSFEPVWSWILTMVACAAMLAATGLAYPRRIQHLSVGWRRLLIGLRLAMILLLCGLLLRPALVLESTDQSEAILYVLTDASRSMQTTDVPGGGSRRDALLRTLADADPGLKAIAEKAEIRIRDFSDLPRSVEAPGPVADGSVTAIGKTLEATSVEIARSRVPALLLLGDGRQAASGALDVDPVAVAKQFGRAQRAIYSVGYGSTEASTTGIDLALEELDVSREVFQGNVLPIRVRLKASGAQGQNVRVRVMLENRSGKVDGQSGPMEAVPLSEENKSVVSIIPQGASEDQLIRLQVAPTQAGDLKLAVEADVLPGEVRKTNNRVETIIRVRRGGIRVAYFDIPRSEQKWIKKVNDSTRIQLDFYPIRAGAFLNRNEIPDRFFEPGNYDGYIIGDLPSTAFTGDQLVKLAECVSRGSGLLMTGGHQNYGQGGYAQSPLAPLFPIELPPENQQLTDPQKMLPSRDGLSHYVLQIASGDQNRTRWEALPPLTGANLLRPRDRSLAQILATSEQGYPLLIAHNVGLARVMVFAGDTTWQWVMKGFAEEHARFWRQTILWLTRKETDDEQSVWITATPRDLSPGQVTELAFGARNTETGQLISAAQYEVTVTNPKGELQPVAVRAGAGMSLADYEKTLEPGDYWARVRATVDGQAIAGIAVTRFHVNARDPELDDSTADYSQLREISFASGGEFLTPEQLLEKLQEWAENGLPGLSLTRREQITLWDNWFSLLLIVILLTLEWAIRKKRGLV
ncbi:MAG: glutamine amidotransferase [Planctomycetota bacterium]